MFGSFIDHLTGYFSVRVVVAPPNHDLTLSQDLTLISYYQVVLTIGNRLLAG